MASTALQGRAQSGTITTQSGLNAAARNLDVIGNNIANASTVGAKLARAEFAGVYANATGAQASGDTGMGVEIDAFHRPVAYHLLRAHPGGSVAASRERERVPADEVLHRFVSNELEQTRGIPWAHAAMRRLNDLKGYREAAVIAARVGAAKMGFFTTPEPEALADGTDADGVPFTSAEAGQFGVLPPGVGFQQFDPAYPHEQFDAFNKACLRGIASALGVSYNSLANDLEGVNFSSIRSGVLEERDEWVVLQDWFIEQILEPVYEQWLGYALALGKIVQVGVRAAQHVLGDAVAVVGLGGLGEDVRALGELHRRVHALELHGIGGVAVVHVDAAHLDLLLGAVQPQDGQGVTDLHRVVPSRVAVQQDLALVEGLDRSTGEVDIDQLTEGRPAHGTDLLGVTVHLSGRGPERTDRREFGQHGQSLRERHG